MKRIVLSAWLLASLAACNDSTQPSEPSVTPPAAAVAAVAQQFTVRDLGTLGGVNSQASGINTSGQVVGISYTSYGSLHSFRTAPGAGINPATDDLGNAWATSINSVLMAIPSPTI